MGLPWAIVDITCPGQIYGIPLIKPHHSKKEILMENSSSSASTPAFVAKVEVRPSPLLFWLRVSLNATSKGIDGRAPNTIFGFIPAGYKTIAFPMSKIAAVAVNTKVSVPRVLFGLLIFFGGLAAFLSNPFLGFVLLILGAAVFVAGLTAELEIENTGGGKQGVKVSLLDRSAIENFAGKVQASVLEAG